MKVLIAEDDATSRTILTSVLTQWGYEPVPTSDGRQAWDIMQQPDAPKLAILDWEMPGLNGLDICRRIQDMGSSNPPYCIVLTARDQKADIVKGLDAGANDYMSKPYDKNELQARINAGRRMVELQTELLETKNALAREAMHDPLTGALNRRAVLEGLERELNRAERHNSYLSIGLCDIDHFKEVNDRYGHQAGDVVLCAFVKTVQHNIRGHDLLGRYGGEEFLMVLPESRGGIAEGLYERLRTRIADTRITTPTGEVGITVSIGVARGRPGIAVEALLASADAALYKAKHAGRNRIVYASDMNNK
ncbi:MAG: diguanylate cyclase [Deltaproteobacteria bacterium]|nr:diguanylate cyclase [Deltaproteobacteria bacterium]